MKADVSRWLLGRLEKKRPEFLRRRQIQILMDLAAGSFGVPGEKISGLSTGEALRRYAEFTCRCMEAARQIQADGLTEENRCMEKSRATAGIDPVEEKLYRDARKLGERIRRITGFTEAEDQNRLIVFLYGNIDIRMEIRGTLRTEDTGRLTVSDCYFSRFYTPDQCRIMSLVDSGIVSGICGGGRLRFNCRITEGSAFCQACMTGGEPCREKDALEVRRVGKDPLEERNEGRSGK